jgi:pilus assembly protein Flp/PilA
MINLINTVHAWLLSHTKSEKGATAVEYGLMVSLIAVAIIIAVTALGDALVAIFDEVAAAI